MAPPHLPQGRGQLRRQQGRDQGAEPALLHAERLAEHLHGSGLTQGLHQEGQILRRGVVDLGLLHQQGLNTLPRRCPGARRQGLRQGEAQEIGAIQLPAAQAHPNPHGCSGGVGPETAGPAGHQGGAGGGGELAGGKSGAGGQGHAAQPGDLEHRRSGQGEQAMGRGHAAMAGGRGGAEQVVHPQMQQRRADPHHIHEGIEGPHLMKMHPLHRMAMHRRLGLGQQGEHRQHPLPQGGIQRGLGDPLAQLPPGPVGWVRLKALHRQVEAPQTAAAALLHHQPVTAGQAEGLQGLVQHRFRHLEIQEGGQQHVARQTGGAIEQGERHGLASGLSGLPRRGA